MLPKMKKAITNGNVSVVVNSGNNNIRKPVNPISFDKVITVGGEVSVTNIFNLAADYYSSNNNDAPLIYNTDLAHRRYSLSKIFENRVKNAIIQAYKGAFTLIGNRYSNKSSVYRRDVYIGEIDDFIENHVIPKYDYLFDINSYLDGGVFTNTSNIVDCILALSTDFDIYATHKLNYYDLGLYRNIEEEPSEELMHEFDRILSEARGQLGLIFSRLLAENFIIVLKDFDIYYNAGITNKQLETL